MTFNSPTNPGSVWTNTTRTITGNGNAITTNDGSDNLSLANGSIASFITSTNVMGIITIVGISLANVIWNFGLTNGSTFRQGNAGASATPAIFHGACNQSEGLALQNNGTVSGNYTFARVDWNK